MVLLKNRPWTLEWSGFPRKLRAGNSEAYVGALEIVVISKPFTAGEDAVMSWVNAQDETLLIDATPLPDGRDVLFLRRQHSKQSLTEAVLEHQRHVRTVVRLNRLTRDLSLRS